MPEKLFDNPVVDRQWPLSTSEEDMKLMGFGFAGDQLVYRFPNGFGASLVQICVIRKYAKDAEVYTGIHPVTDERLWEMSVVYFNSEDDLDFTLTFETSVADDVIRFITDSRAELILRQIKELPSVPVTGQHT